jgi:undecaprenol kinase
VKNLPFRQRVRFAVSGIRAALRTENSFRIHLLVALSVLAILVWRHPVMMWWAIITLTMMVVLAAELVNTAVEHLADHLHPDQHPRIKIVKDCAAAAVLIASIGAVGVGAAFVLDQWR